MKKFKSRFIYLSLPLFVITFLAIYQWKTNSSLNPSLKSDQIVQEKIGLARLIKNSSEIHRIWWEGEESKEWIRLKDLCLKKWGITKVFDESLLRCNPMLIECVNEFDKGKKFELSKIEGLDLNYKYLSFENSEHLKIPNTGYYFRIIDNISKQHLDILLEDKCHEVYLDQRIYSYGEMPKKSEGDDFRFDNFNMNIYLDKSLVTNFDVNQWIIFSKSKLTKGLKINEGDELFRPVTHLTYNQMENYCAFKSKQLMMAHYFDAATFLPSDLEIKEPSINERSSYYWTKNKLVKNITCDLVFGSECLTKEEFRMNKISPTWAGINDSMGGILEAFYNPIEPEMNLKVSSFYLPLNSKFQHLGTRAHWDGEGFSLNHFNFFDMDIDKNQSEYKVGFRCMRQSQ